MTELLEYKRPELTEKDAIEAGKIARKISAKPRLELWTVVTLLLLENHRLTVEVNEHRAVRGFAPLKEHHVK